MVTASLPTDSTCAGARYRFAPAAQVGAAAFSGPAEARLVGVDLDAISVPGASRLTAFDKDYGLLNPAQRATYDANVLAMKHSLIRVHVLRPGGQQ